MTLFAGCLCLNNRDTIPPRLKSDIISNLRRTNDSRGQTYSYNSDVFFLTKWDSGAFGESAWFDGSIGSVSTLVGDPLHTRENQRVPRSEQLAFLDLFNENIHLYLSETRGSFSILSYVSDRHCLKISTDMLGMRSVYYLVQDGLFIFSSALRILEAIKSIIKKPSIIGMAERSIYGQPLSFRSPYESISVLRECEVLTVTNGGIDIFQYYDWSITEPSPQNETEAAEYLYKLFSEGIELRLLTGEQSLAFLSGGMDSRAIVATLMAYGHSVLALNFSPVGSQDQEYAIQFSDAAGDECKLICLPRDEDPNFSLLAYRAKQTINVDDFPRLLRPEVLWSGDGGSVGLGHVYMDEEMVELCENEGIESAVRYFTNLHHHHLPVGIFSSKWRQTLPKLVFQNVVAEVKRYSRSDCGKQLYLFLLMNDQRRHLTKHFETIDEHGLEFLTPFFDSHFLRAVASTPVRWGILHRLYALWFTHLPDYAQATPWQTYPGHIECPIQVSNNLSYQWRTQSTTSSVSFADRLKQGWKIIEASAHPLPVGLFSRARILFSGLLLAFGLRDTSHVLKTIRNFSTSSRTTKIGTTPGDTKECYR